MTKRIFDIFISLLGIFILFPLFLIISILVLLDDHGPILFIQQRVGFRGKLFQLYKFRTMLISKFSENGHFDAGDKSRVTHVGKFLRKSKLDELPQLFNVLKGDMSIVGPRPEIKLYTEHYPERWAIVCNVKPGITDNASIEFRNEEEILGKSQNPKKTYEEVILPMKLRLCEQYVNDQSFIGDLKIIFKTIYVLISK
jgi:lipopolysaccharide/colanic/teichoic acid biosynthesis glycosyltransferase